MNCSVPSSSDLAHREDEKRIDFVVYPGFKALETMGAMSVFKHTNLHLSQEGCGPKYRIQIVAPKPGRVASDTFMTLEAQALPDLQNLPDTAIVVGSRTIASALADHPGIVDWVARAEPLLGRLVAICSGSLFLTTAGVTASVTPDAPEGASGVNIGIDLALSLVESDLGHETALAVARNMAVYLKRPGGQSLLNIHLSSQRTRHPGIREAQDWILNNLSRPLSLPELADKEHMSERNFRRVFTKEVGQGPHDFIESARLQAARMVLEESNLALKSIAHRVGFSSEQSLRKLFLNSLKITPKEYRERFNGTQRT